MIYYLNYFLITFGNFIAINISKQVKAILYFIVFLYFSIFIGLRFKVGGDWNNYLEHYKSLSFEDIMNSLISWDPGYVLIEYVSKYLGLGIWGVNFLCAIIFLMGFLFFVKTFQFKLVRSLLIAFPYMIMVVVMGYTRQGVALGLIMASYALFYKRIFFKYTLMTIFAILFHKSAIIGFLLPLYKSNIKIKFLSLIGLIVSIFLLKDKLLAMYLNYIIHPMDSKGAFVRVLLNTLSAVIFLFFFKRYKKIFDDFYIWKFFSYITFFALFLVILFPFTTFVDRMLLYFYPLQILVFNRIFYLIKDKNLKSFIFLAMVLLYWIVITIWLNFALHKDGWIPYNNFLFY